MRLPELAELYALFLLLLGECSRFHAYYFSLRLSNLVQELHRIQSCELLSKLLLHQDSYAIISQ